MTGLRGAAAAVLTLVAGGAVAQEPAPGEFVSGASYSTRYGPTAFVGLEGSDIMGSGVDAGLQFRAGERGSSASLEVGRDTPLGYGGLGASPVLSVSLSGEKSDWDFLPFTRESVGAEAVVAAGLGGTFSYRAGLFWMWDDVGDLDDDVSPLIKADEGGGHAAGLLFGLGYDTVERSGLLRSGTRVAGTVRVAGGDRQWTQVEVDADRYWPLGDWAVLRLGGEVGLIDGRGEDVTIIDRVFLGGGSPRGFAFGGLSPRDARTDDALGGTRYATGTAEVMFPVNKRGLFMGLFIDAGANWHLPGITSESVDDSYHLRTSAGLAVEWALPVGRLQVSFAEPIRYRDDDERQQISVALTASF